MDQAKRTFRDVKTGIKKAARGLGGADVKDQIGNAGDVIGRDLGNTGDAAGEAKRRADDPAVTPERTI